MRIPNMNDRLMDDDVVECQQCGIVLKLLSPAEAQRVALNPYGFVAFCHQCSGEQTTEGDSQ